MYTKNLNSLEINEDYQYSRPIIKKPFRHITLTVPSSDIASFNEIFYLEPQYVAQALRLTNTFQAAIDPLTLNFDFEKALQIANGLPNAGITGTLNQSVIQQTIEISVMISQIKEIIRNVLGLVINSTNFWNSVLAAITNTFTNLEPQVDENWIVWRNLSATHTSYYYKILFSIQNEDTGAFMAVLPIAFEITVDVQKQQLLFITIRDSARYEVKMKALTVVQLLDSYNAPIIDVFNVHNYGLYQSNHPNHHILQNLNLNKIKG
ncbi:type-2Aa cytolytic delta-endotoxin [Bacillus thuringiensis]|uniref:Type-2Bb cytolytic delta-endotoxin n=2 Tax=Bacillus thuringiensis subsp. jegathesan TaxID=56955 RepID=CT2BB_BACTJ|nr:type-2Aa cytolytic delta-endotoxin [Bacillus thuringiensis]O32322.1 RecName: Full=Type-2Bb cytolytic delta-endotoxin; AltName: Full=30 kDa cytolytic toxin [Bacillus thuringiensis serovar jegathesan]AAB93477.1 cytolytic toxin [Bacillus thuringiensis serovar jegathesan]OUB57314.1 type-2Aa cytolytic delta-endotoxin [Bacillus thuringiensis serovar jegathesan]